MQPRQTRDTVRPVRPSLAYFIACLRSVERLNPPRGVTAAGGARAHARGMSRPRLGFVALGLAALAEERIAGVVRFVEDTTRSVGAPIAELTAPLVPEPLRRLIEAAVADLDERGRTVAEAGAVRGNELAELVADRVSQDPAMQKVVDNVIDNVLPDVLERLAKEPEQI